MDGFGRRQMKRLYFFVAVRSVVFAIPWFLCRIEGIGRTLLFILPNTLKFGMVRGRKTVFDDVHRQSNRYHANISATRYLIYAVQN